MNIHDIENKKYFMEKFVKQTFHSPSENNDIIDIDQDVADEEISVDEDNTYTVHDKKYFYSGDEYLRKDFAYELNFQNDHFDVFIVMFRINDGLETPFIEYSLQKSVQGNQYEFSQFVIKKNEFSDLDNNNNDEHPANTHFKAKIAEHMKNVIKQPVNMDTQYKGFIEHNNSYFVFLYKDNDEPSGNWAMYDEIYNIKHIDFVPLHDNVISLLENKNLHQIRNSENKIVPTPVCGFIVKQNDKKELQNVLLEEDFYENTYHFDEYDGVYIFTKEPILKEGGPYKKYAISLRESLYINKDDEKQKSVFKEYKSVYYVQSDIVYYLMYYYDHFHELE